MKNLLFNVASFLFLFFVGCAEKPNTGVGGGIANPDGEFIIDTVSFFANSDTTYHVPLITGYTISNLTGKLPNNGTATTMLKITPTSSELTILSTIDTLVSAELRLVVNYRFNVAAAQVQLNINRITSPWSEGSFTSDSVLALDPKIIGTFSDSMNYGSTISAPLDTTEIRNWINANIDTTKPAFYGFAISGTGTGIIGFTPFNLFSTITPEVFIKFMNEGVEDSITLSYGEDTYLAKYDTPPILNPITVQGGFGIRSKIIFDLSSLVNEPIINSAAMELTLDSVSSSFSGYSPDSVVALVALSNSVTDSSLGTSFAYGYRKTPGMTVYSFNLRKIIDGWVRHTIPNYGLTLRWASEVGTAEHAVFYSSTHSDISKRPLLKITYAAKPIN